MAPRLGIDVGAVLYAAGFLDFLFSVQPSVNAFG
jgi:hypothetical protein